MGLLVGWRENIIWWWNKYEKMYDFIDCFIDFYVGGY